MSFGIYLIGFIVMVAGLAYGAYLLRVPQHWIAVGVIVLTGIAIWTGATSTRHRDRSV